MFSGVDGGGLHRPCLRHAVENVAQVSHVIVPFAMFTEQQRAHSRFPGHALTPTGVMAIRCKQFHLPDL